MAALETAARLLGVRARAIMRLQRHLPCLISSWPASPVQQFSRPMPALSVPSAARWRTCGRPLFSPLPCVACCAFLSSGVGRGAGGRADDARH